MNELQYISHSFRTDAVQLLEKANSALRSSDLSQRDSFLAKIAVDAFMSIECSLKSLICSKDPSQDAKEAYRLLRKSRHKIIDLLKNAGSVTLTEEETAFLSAAQQRGVRLRYCLDLLSLTTCDLIECKDPRFVIDRKYVNQILAIAAAISEQANHAHQNAFPLDPRPVMQTQIEALVMSLRQIIDSNPK